MKNIEVKAYAKINLALDVLNKRSDGYHEVRMLMQSIKLHDIVYIELTETGDIDVSCDSQWVPPGKGNIAYKAAELILERYNLRQGIKITIKKNIPVAAGLAGGSSNAAAIIKGFNEIFELGLSQSDMMALGKQIGADVPFCIKGGTMLAEGIGEKLTSVKPLKETSLLLARPGIGVSTAWVYNNLILENIKERPEIDAMISAVEKNQIDYIARNMKNVLETVTIPRYPVIGRIKSELLKNDALGSMMSGSGPTVFGIFKDKETAQKAFQFIKRNNRECILTETTCGESEI
jgi:4-diphosphocytidyl-2-C-methyl-D-erythritol kinase